MRFGKKRVGVVQPGKRFTGKGFVRVAGNCLAFALLASTAFVLGVPSLALASPSVRASSPDLPSVETAQRVARVFGHLLAQTNLSFEGRVQLVRQPGFYAAAVFGAPGHIQIDETYANGLTDGELTFVFSHELAHLLGDHHQRLKIFYSKRTLLQSQGDERALHHELESDADLQGVKWAVQAGYSASDAATALERAYEGAHRGLHLHPTISERTALLLAKR